MSRVSATTEIGEAREPVVEQASAKPAGFAPRILSIDGGGLRGAMPAALLAEVEATLGRRVVDHFDLIVGTSTGGIIALGLALELPASDVLSFYVDDGPAVFGQSAAVDGWSVRLRASAVKAWRKIRQARRSKYDSDGLKAALSKRMQHRRLGEARTRLVIPAYDSIRKTVYLYKTAHHERLKSDYKQLAVDVAMATAAAPTYFDAYSSDHATGLRDGGIWANDPTGIAVIEGHAMLQWDMTKARVLSLGSASEFFSYDLDAGYIGKSLPGYKLIQLLMEAQAKAAQSTAKLMLGHPHKNADGLLRIDVQVPNGWGGLDDARRIKQLAGIGRALARENMPMIEHLFFSPGVINPFEPKFQLGQGATQ